MEAYSIEVRRDKWKMGNVKKEERTIQIHWKKNWAQATDSAELPTWDKKLSLNYWK